MKNLFIILILILTNQNLHSQNKPAYPEPKEGFKRVDLLLPKMEGEENYQIEVRFGMKWNTVECADADFTFLQKNLITKYGIPNSQRFEYYWIEKDEAEISQGFPEGCESKTKILKKILSTRSVTIRYQSYYPVPFYIPKSWTLEYRIWKTDNTYITIDNN